MGLLSFSDKVRFELFIEHLLVTFSKTEIELKV